jgi:hypothetical protein
MLMRKAPCWSVVVPLEVPFTLTDTPESISPPVDLTAPVTSLPCDQAGYCKQIIISSESKMPFTLCFFPFDRFIVLIVLGVW